jgi:hypothetical protein
MLSRASISGANPQDSETLIPFRCRGSPTRAGCERRLSLQCDVRRGTALSASPSPVFFMFGHVGTL